MFSALRASSQPFFPFSPFSVTIIVFALVPRCVIQTQLPSFLRYCLCRPLQLQNLVERKHNLLHGVGLDTLTSSARTELKHQLERRLEALAAARVKTPDVLERRVNNPPRGSSIMEAMSPFQSFRSAPTRAASVMMSSLSASSIPLAMHNRPPSPIRSSPQVVRLLAPCVGVLSTQSTCTHDSVRGRFISSYHHQHSEITNEPCSLINMQLLVKGGREVIVLTVCALVVFRILIFGITDVSKSPHALCQQVAVDCMLVCNFSDMHQLLDN